MIKVLDSFVSDKIAAGEVIEKPLSIIKELIENSIDAGASSIIVEIKNGGKSYIRVTDNGSGIVSDELETAFLRHATGKISTVQDLDKINTLGFRGEALASISAVSRLTVVTRTQDSMVGTKLVMHGGKKISLESVGSNTGTTMIVEDIFYNIPARRKFMGSDAREASAIISLVEKLAIYYASIKFMLINNDKTIISTTGNGDYRSAISNVYPDKEYKDLIEVNSQTVRGYISAPSVTKTNRKGQIFFVNGRIVSSKVIEKGIEDGYGRRIFSGYPIAVLFVTVPPETIDVNIHPGKKEIKLLDENNIINEISKAIESALNVNKLVAELHPKRDVFQSSYVVNESVDENSINSVKNVDYIDSTNHVNANHVNVSEEKVIAEPISVKEYIATRNLHSCDNNDDSSNAKIISEDDFHSIDLEDDSRSIDLDEATSRPFEFEDLSYAGYIFNSYIVTETRDAIYMVDQHAAHERIFYEKLINEYNNQQHNIQPILAPFLIEVSSAVYNTDRGWIELMQRMGYDIEDFGENTFVVRGIPSFMTLAEADTFAHRFIDNIGDLRDNSTVIDKLIVKSCKAAVKANNRLSEMEIKELLDKLSMCSNPFCCPHGRPTFIKMTRYEIERTFKRV